MQWKHILPTLLLAAAAAVAPAPARAAGPVTINFDAANPPFMFAKDGKPAGIYPAIIQAAFKHMNTPLTMAAEPWKRALEEVDGGRAGIGGVYKNSEREKKYDFSTQIFTEKLVVYFNKTAPVNFSKVADLKGKKVGVIRGWSYGDEFDDARKSGLLIAEDGDSDEATFRKLDVGHLDAVVAVNESGNGLLPKFKNIGAAATPLSQNGTFIAFAKSANLKDVLKSFDQTYKDMQKSGEIKTLVAASLAK
jgi:polar amino acid transport system substrate-binding protein